MDGEFVALQEKIEAMPGGPRVNLLSANEHVSQAERRIRVVKEQVRAMQNMPPFTRVPRLMIIHMVINAVKMLNYFPMKGGISPPMSPKALLDGLPLDFKQHLRAMFGA